MSAWAKPGVKCICVNAGGLGIDAGVLSAGAIYTVRSTGFMEDFAGNSGFGIRLEEVQRAACPITGVVDLGFNVDRFRPVINRTQEQDLEHFLPLLNTVEEPA